MALSGLLTDPEQFNSACQNALVINAHGGKTSQTFDLGGHIILTPDSLLTDYTYSTANSQSAVEKNIKKGELKPIQGGQWTAYGLDLETSTVPDVRLSILDGTILTFANKLEQHNSWKGISTDIDNAQRHYCDKDPDAGLIIKKPNGEYDFFQKAEAKAILIQIKNGTYNQDEQGIPVCFYAPKVNKCKVLSNIKLSEILPEIKKVAGERMFVLATCNAGANPKNIHLDHANTSIELIDVLKKVNPKITAIKEDSLIVESNIAKGSNPGGVYKDKLGKKFYVKFPHKRKWDGNPSGSANGGTQEFGQEMGNNAVKNEILAAKFYQLGGIRVPTLSLVETKDKGCLGIASEMVEFTQYTQLDANTRSAVLAGGISGLYEGFAFDVWLGNWDVYGANGDNIGVVTYSDGRQEVMRIDLGGSLEYRACGLLKGNPDGNLFKKDDVEEINNLPKYNKIFQNIPEESIIRGVEKIAEISDEAIIKIIKDNNGPGDQLAQKRLAEKLIQRKRFLMNKYGIRPDIVTFNKDFTLLDSLEQQYKISVVAGPPLTPIVPTEFEDYLQQTGGQNNLYEPEFKDIKGKQKSAGVLIVEDDGRVWMYEPKNQFGGYHNTFPKGRLDGQDPQTAAIREAFEETGLQVEIVGYLGDFEKSTTNNRYYIAKRVGGVPFGWKGTDLQPCKSGEIEETKAVILVDSNKLAELEKLNFGSAKGMDLPIVSQFLEVQKEAISLGKGSFFTGLEIIQQKANKAAVLSSPYSGSKVNEEKLKYYSEICKQSFEKQIKGITYVHVDLSSQDNNHIVGELRTNVTPDAAGKTHGGELLAVIKYGSIECPKIGNNDNLSDTQYKAFIAFLKMESKLAKGPITIKINYFSPKELEFFFIKLNKLKSKLSNIILELPSSLEKCVYGDNQQYDLKEYEMAILAVEKYNNKESSLLKFSKDLGDSSNGSSKEDLPKNSHGKTH